MVWQSLWVARLELVPEPTGNGAPAISLSRPQRVAVRLGCLLCPPGTFDNLLAYLASVMGPSRGFHAMLRFVRDGLAHLRRHGAVPISGLLVLGAGTFLFSFVSAPVPFRILWGIVGTGLAVAATVVMPKAPALRGGCPYALEASPQPPMSRLRHLRQLTGPLGALVLISPIFSTVHKPFYWFPGTIGSLTAGSGLLIIAASLRGGKTKRFHKGLYVSGAGALLIAYSNAAVGFMIARGLVHVAALLVSAAGCLVYGLSVKDLVRAYTPPEDKLTALPAAPQQMPPADDLAPIRTIWRRG